MNAEQGTDSAPTATTRDVVITRIFDAPRELVFQAWTEPEHFKQWWGPKGFTTPHCTIDLRVGGTLHGCMRSPEGEDYWFKGIFHEIAPPERLVYTDSFADAEGNAVSPAEYGMPDWPMESTVTLTFEEVDEGKTKFTLRHAGLPEGTGSDMTEAGWGESFDRLAEYVANESGR